MTNDNDDLLVAEYTLGLLDEAEARAFEQRLQREPALRAGILHWSEHFAALYEDVDEVAPPPAAKARIEQRLFPGKAKPSSLSFWPVTWASSLLVAALMVFFFHQPQQNIFQSDYMASLETQDQSLQIVANYNVAKKLLKVSSIKAAPAAGRSHELWLIAGNNPPVSLGTLNSINNRSIPLSIDLASVIIGSTLAISDEPVGGSPTGAPTGEVLTTATVVRI